MKKINIINLILLFGALFLNFNLQGQSIAAGGWHTVALCNNGTVNAFGENASGQLGNGNTTDSNVPLTVSGLTNIIAVGGGGDQANAYSLALKSDGKVWAWGSNSYGNFGNGNTTNSMTPVQTINISSVAAIAVKGWHSVALLSNGTVWSWGLNSDGQLGNGANTNSSVPVQATSLSSIFKIAAGTFHTLALRSDGTVWAWGANASGQLGNGTTTASATPIQVSGLNNIVSISAGRYFSMAVKNDGTVWTWGENLYGQLGNGNNTDSPIPVQVTSLTGVNAGIIAAGDFHCMAVKNDGTVWSWGRNSSGSLGNNTTTNSNIPVLVTGITDVIGLASGTNFSILQKNDGTFWGCGRNASGQLGDATNTQRNTVVQSTAMCTVMPPIHGIPQLISSTPKVLSIAAGGWHSVAICSDSTVKAFGENASGQLGNSSTTDSNVPVTAAGLTSVIQVSAGGDQNNAHSMALKANGTVWTWGSNIYGGLGNGTTGIANNSGTPIQTLNITTAIAISAGGWHSVALLNNGTVWSWGLNADGQLGDNTTTNSSTPVQASGLSDVYKIAGGSYHTLALKNDGTVWAWGANASGQLGNGTTNPSSVPVQVAGLSNIVHITAGRFFSMAVRNDGTVWTWGENLYGQLGIGNNTDSYLPVQITSLSGVNLVVAASGAFHCFAVKNDGTIWSWGRNTYGNLGDNTTTDSNIPILVSGSTNPIGIAAGTNFSLLFQNDGTFWGCGRNASGQLGDGTNTMRKTFVQSTAMCAVLQPTINTPLPLGILNIEAQITSTGNQITWETDCAFEDGKFTLQHCSDGIRFENLADISPISNLNCINTKQYNYTHNTNVAISYYRIKQTDLEGNYIYSKVVSLQNASNEKLSLYPNPVSDNLHIQSFGSEVVSVTVLDATGNIVFSNNQKDANPTLNINTSHWTKGIYFVRIVANNKQSTHKIIKQ